MTAQINDAFLYRGDSYALAGISEGELIDVHAFGIKPAMATTACWRGYQAFFTLAESRLILDALYVNLIREGGKYEREAGPAINGVMPACSKEGKGFFNNLYEGLHHPISYSGGLLIAQGFIHDLYVHMGFHPAWKYERVMELIFEKGMLKATFDRSEPMAVIRKKIIASKAENDADRKPTQNEIARFVERAFDRKYNVRSFS
jgi:hypothetical protein